MKKFLLLPVFLFCGYLQAADLVFSRGGQPESTYDITQSSVAISSSTTSVDVSTTGYRRIYIFNTSATTFYYRIDGSTQNTALMGYPIYPNTEGSFETNNIVGYKAVDGSVGSIDVRKKIIRK